jgi:phosphoserine aminotransferase
MTKQIYNFGAGPAMLPIPVMQQIQEEFLDFRGMGASVIEISHRSKEFDDVINRCDELVRNVASLPENYQILYTHGGARMQFSAVPMNLLPLKPAHKAVYSETGNFSKQANVEAARFGEVLIASSGEASKYDRLPPLTRDMVPDDASYAYITSNNTIYGTQYQTFPELDDIPLVVDATSDIFSRPVDFSSLGLVFASLQKNLGPAGTALVIIRDDLMGHAMEKTPSLLDYTVYAKSHSLSNTNNTFAIYTMCLVMEWLKNQGGVEAMDKANTEKANTLYQVIDGSDFYKGTAYKKDRSLMNVTFTLPDDALTQKFLSEALENGLYALKGHRLVGGIRASIYNAMPLEGCQALAAFMQEFERTNG